jgi:hypothetical protein
MLNETPSPGKESSAAAAGAAVVAAGAAVVATAAELLAELLAPSSPSDPQAPAINPSAKTAETIRHPRRLISVSIKKAPSYCEQIQRSDGLTIWLSHHTSNICGAQTQNNYCKKNCEKPYLKPF